MQHTRYAPLAAAITITLLVCAVPSAPLRAVQLPPPPLPPERQYPYGEAINASTDVPFLQQLATWSDDAAAFASSFRDNRIRPRDVRKHAYIRLGTIGTPDSVAAINAIEAALSNISLTPQTLKGDVWTLAPWHFGDSTVRSMAESRAPDGTTYRVVWWHLLGPRRLFLMSTRTPVRRDSWTRPLLIDHDIGEDNIPRDGTLTWKGAQKGTFTYRKIDHSRVEVPISVAALRLDSDHDGWTDIEERWLGLNPRRADTDGDGIQDGRDTCPLLPKPSQTDDLASAIQRVFLVRFAFSDSRDAIFVRPDSVPVHVFGYGGPVLFGRDLPRDFYERHAIYASWRVLSSSDDEMLIEMDDWGMGESGERYVVRRVQGQWVVVRGGLTWVS